MSYNISHTLKSYQFNIWPSLTFGQYLSKQYSVKKIYFNQKGELVTGEGGKDSKKIITIEKWTDAYIMYCSIYASAHPTSVQGLFKYMGDGKIAAAKGGGVRKLFPSHKDFLIVPKIKQDHLTPKVLDTVEILSLARAHPS